MVDRDRNRDKVGTSDSKEAAMAVAKRAIDNALDPQKIEAYSASMISFDLRHEPSIIEYALRRLGSSRAALIRHP